MTQDRITASGEDHARQEALRLKRVRKPLGASCTLTPDVLRTTKLPSP